MKKSIGKSLVAAAGGLFGLIYLINPGAGVLEILPDNLPIIGNIDEAAASTILIWALAYFGLDITRIFRTKQPEGQTTAKVIDAEEVTSKDV